LDFFYPEGYKSYSKTKPMNIEEFRPEKAWWENREEDELSWKVAIEEIKTNGCYNLDIKNPNNGDVGHGNPDELLEKYKNLIADVTDIRHSLKQELMKALGNT
jgi:type I restriction enzyme M protein